MLNFEDKFYNENVINIVGTDEAGRGPLLGPVVAAAVILPRDFNDSIIDDSKKLTEKKREQAFKLIQEHALAIGIGIVEAEEIDRINIYEAARKAMKIAIQQIKIPFQLVLTDCMPLPGENYNYMSIVKGDAKARCIAASSIIAKVTRDHLMYEIDEKYPQYGIKKHKGYGTKLHLDMLEKYGPIEGIHRKSFKPVSKYYSEQLKLF